MELSKALMERILSNLGLKSMQVGIASPENLLKKKLKLEEEDYSIRSYDVWGGECYTGNLPLKVIASDIGTKENPDLIVVIAQEESHIVLKYSWKDFDQGTFMTRYNDKWVDMTMVHKLNLASAFELITQNGLPWMPSQNPEELFGVIASILSE